jgi:phosphoserine aminotransferase
MAQVYNFSAGPATLPKAVMEQAQAEFVDYHGKGFGIIEASHRGAAFDEVIGAAESNLRELLGIPDSHCVLFLQGGASTQFAMLPMNLAPNGNTAYADTGAWSAKAIKEAGRLTSDVNVVASSKDANYSYIPDVDGWAVTDDAAYLHVTSNNTIAGTQYDAFPTPPAGVPLLADMSSDILSRPLNVADFGVIYAGAQKNIGPSGCALVIMDKALANREPGNIPVMMTYNTHIDKDSMFNTPPTFAIYMIRLVTDWLKGLGGLSAMQAMNEAKAGVLYGAIDADDFYSCPVQTGSRSLMNVCFRLPSEELEAAFIAEAAGNGLIGLKGHRSVGGCRASIYNAMPADGVQTLIDFMGDFKQRNG